MPSQTVWISLILLTALILGILVIREVIVSDRRKAQAAKAEKRAEPSEASEQSTIRKPNRKRDRKNSSEQP